MIVFHELENDKPIIINLQYVERIVTGVIGSKIYIRDNEEPIVVRQCVQDIVMMMQPR
jgi:hypothetical protein